MSGNGSLVDILRRYKEVARPIILKYFLPDSCIASTRITIEVLQHFGIQAVPFSCGVLIFNRYFCDRIAKEGRIPTAKEVQDWNDDKAWSVGLGLPTNDPHYVGHLVAIVEQKYLVDASLDQAARPGKHIEVPSVLVEAVPQSFCCGQGVFVSSALADGYMRYQPQIDHMVYKTSPDWNDPYRRVPAVNEILRAMRRSTNG